MIIWTHAYMESFIFILDEQHIQVYLTFITLLIPYQNDYEQMLAPESGLLMLTH